MGVMFPNTFTLKTSVIVVVGAWLRQYDMTDRVEALSCHLIPNRMGQDTHGNCVFVLILASHFAGPESIWPPSRLIM